MILEIYRKAETGYKFCLDHLRQEVEKKSQDLDILEVYGMAMDFYARMLAKQAKYKEAQEYFLKVYDILVRLYGEEYPEVVTILNDLGTISHLSGKNDEAIEYLQKAIEIGNPNRQVYVNQNLIKLHYVIDRRQKNPGRRRPQRSSGKSRNYLHEEANVARGEGVVQRRLENGKNGQLRAVHEGSQNLPRRNQ